MEYYKKIVQLLFILILSAYVATTWIELSDALWFAMWKHYVALVGVIILIILAITSFRRTFWGIIIFLVIGTFGYLSLTAGLTRNQIGIGGAYTPYFNLKCFLWLLLYCALNTPVFIEMHLDAKEKKASKSA